MDNRNYTLYSISAHIICGILCLVTLAAAEEYPENIVLQNQTITTDEDLRFIASGTIIAGPAVTIENGARVILGAGNRVTIMPGFRATNGKVSLFINKDTDADGLFDWWEIVSFKNLNQVADGDYDGDKLTNLQEFQEDLDPTGYNTDNDQDSMADWWELLHFDSLAEGADEDYDDDLTPNILEFIAGTSPSNSADVPGDGTHYGYDELGRLYSEFELTGGNVALRIQYAYDEIGNITRKIVGGTNP